MTDPVTRSILARSTLGAHPYGYGAYPGHYGYGAYGAHPGYYQGAPYADDAVRRSLVHDAVNTRVADAVRRSQILAGSTYAHPHAYGYGYPGYGQHYHQAQYAHPGFSGYSFLKKKSEDEKNN